MKGDKTNCKQMKNDDFERLIADYDKQYDKRRETYRALLKQRCAGKISPNDLKCALQSDHSHNAMAESELRERCVRLLGNRFRITSRNNVKLSDIFHAHTKNGFIKASDEGVHEQLSNLVRLIHYYYSDQVSDPDLLYYICCSYIIIQFDNSGTSNTQTTDGEVSHHYNPIFLSGLREVFDATDIKADILDWHGKPIDTNYMSKRDAVILYQKRYVEENGTKPTVDVFLFYFNNHTLEHRYSFKKDALYQYIYRNKLSGLFDMNTAKQHSRKKVKPTKTPDGSVYTVSDTSTMTTPIPQRPTAFDVSTNKPINLSNYIPTVKHQERPLSKSAAERVRIADANGYGNTQRAIERNSPEFTFF